MSKIGEVFDDLAPDAMIPASELQAYAKDERFGLESEVKDLHSRIRRAEERNETLVDRLRELYGLYRRAIAPGLIKAHDMLASVMGPEEDVETPPFFREFNALCSELFDDQDDTPEWLREDGD